MNLNNRELQNKVAARLNPWRDWPLVIHALVIFAAVLRLVLLKIKAPHFDEGINGHFVMQTWANGYFKYDPSNYHGPLYFYYLHLSEILFGRGIFAFRFATGILASLTVFVTAMHSRFFGRVAYWAAAVIALSPAFIFYGRYAIHETLLILCQLLFSYGFLLRYTTPEGKSSRAAIVFIVAGVFGSFATKETFFIFFGCWFIAFGLTKLFDRVLPQKLRSKDVLKPNQRSSSQKAPGALWIWLAGVGITLALFSGFFVDLGGIADMFRAFAFWTKTGTGATGHEKPFRYWLELMWTYEWPLLFTVFLGVIMSLFGSFWMRVFSACGFGLWLAYSIIPYKTPWCLIGFWPLAFALGFIVEEAPKSTLRLAFKGIALATILVSFGFALRINFSTYHDPKEKYVYVQSTSDLNIVSGAIAKRVALAPEDRAMAIRVWVADTWPMPWLFSLYTNVQYGKYTAGSVPDGDVILIDGPDQAELEKALPVAFIRIPFHLRDAYQTGYAYFEQTRFANLVEGGTVVGGPTK